MQGHAVGHAVGGLPATIEAIGTDRFGDRLLSLLHRQTGAEHCAAFEFGGDRLQQFSCVSLDGTDTARRQFTLYHQGQHWRQDPMLAEARRCVGAAGPMLLRVMVADLPAGALRDVIYGPTNIRERIVICGERERQAYGLSVLRSGPGAGQGSNKGGGFSDGQVDWLHALSDTLLALLAKHAEQVRPAPSPVPSPAAPLTSLRGIETDLASHAASFPRREREVCARILYGMSTAGIALDLGVGEESVVTYRKRAFQRLGIATRRELLLWYLSGVRHA